MLLFFSTGTELLRLDVPHHIAQVFADNVEFEIYDTARFDAVEIGVLVRVGNDRHFEAVGLRVADREAYAIDGDRTFFDGGISLCCHFGREIVCERVTPTAVLFYDRKTACGLVYMSLYDMSVQSAVHLHAAFEIDFVADFQQPEVAALQSLFDGSNRISVAVDADNGEANAVVSYALVDFQFIGK